MKKLGLLFMLAGVFSLGLSSCGGDDGDDTVTPKPAFDWKGGQDYISQDQDVQAGFQVLFGINATGTQNLKSVGVRVSYNGGTETILPIAQTGDTIITDLEVKNFSLDIPYKVGSIPGTEEITVIVTMENDLTASKSILLTVKAAPKALQAINNVEVGAQANSTYGSYFSVSNAQAKLQADANADPADIDFAYYYGATNKATFASPDDNTLQSSNVMGNAQLSSWTTKNATRFKKVSLSFAGTANTTDLDAEIAKGAPNLTAATNTATGDVYLFITDGNAEYGIMEVTSFNNASASGSVILNLKAASN